MTVTHSLVAAAKVLGRHVRNARGRPDRLWWIARRMLGIVAGGSFRAVLERNAVDSRVDMAYPEWVRRFDTIDDLARSRFQDRVLALRTPARFALISVGKRGAAEEHRVTLRSLERQAYQDRIAPTADSPNGIERVDARLSWSEYLTCVSHSSRREFAVFVHDDDRLAEDAMLVLAEAVDAHPAARVVYADHDHITPEGVRHDPFFKPDWNPELLRTSNYIGTPCAVDAGLLCECAWSEIQPSDLWDLFLRVTESVEEQAIVHVPRVLVHRNVSTLRVDLLGSDLAVEQTLLTRTLERRGIAGAVERHNGHWRLRYAIPTPPPLVSVIIPTRDQPDLLRRCIESIETGSTYANREIVIVDNDSRTRAALRLLDDLANSGRARIVRAPGEFNFSAECNRGVAEARGHVVVLLNDDIEVVTPGWLDELVAHALQDGVALVGPLLVYPNGTIQHAGVILGVNGIAAHRFRGCRIDDAHVRPWIAHAQNMSAVSAACAAVRRDTYRALGGLDERLRVANNDIDLCLRAIAAGLRNVWTPHAMLVHHESASRGYENSLAERQRLQAESAIVRARWGALLDNDPAYNLNLTLQGVAYDLAYPPRHRHQVQRVVEAA